MGSSFQSTPPVRGATLISPEVKLQIRISIHAPREGGDLTLLPDFKSELTISIHAPREGGDLKELGK